ncbi:hypothetical protein CEXT_715411 [Caerostris extrusa]|uniref:Uncharacterized protein n=1 Tax=Caerostris extrusa TaxID=172846 RepID=A0AAV4R2E9_CAEEX|nr:hypothetical protein CEXT_715411 [Caerostris extrusa]
MERGDRNVAITPSSGSSSSPLRRISFRLSKEKIICSNDRFSRGRKDRRFYRFGERPLQKNRVDPFLVEETLEVIKSLFLQRTFYGEISQINRESFVLFCNYSE